MPLSKILVTAILFICLGQWRLAIPLPFKLVAETPNIIIHCCLVGLSKRIPLLLFRGRNIVSIDLYGNKALVTESKDCFQIRIQWGRAGIRDRISTKRFLFHLMRALTEASLCQVPINSQLKRFYALDLVFTIIQDPPYYSNKLDSLGIVKRFLYTYIREEIPTSCKNCWSVRIRPITRSRIRF